MYLLYGQLELMTPDIYPRTVYAFPHSHVWYTNMGFTYELVIMMKCPSFMPTPNKWKIRFLTKHQTKTLLTADVKVGNDT